MKFWAVDVEDGTVVDIAVPVGKALLISEATLDQNYPGSRNVSLYIHYKEKKKNILCSLNPKGTKDCSINIVIETNFKLSQSTDNSKFGIVTVRGFFADNPEVEDSNSEDDNKKRNVPSGSNKRNAPSGSKKWKGKGKKQKK